MRTKEGREKLESNTARCNVIVWRERNYRTLRMWSFQSLFGQKFS